MDEISFNCLELIDTLWNVNRNKKQRRIRHSYELIDTLWNVNSHIVCMPYLQMGINRYIMECKYFMKYIEGLGLVGINRYIMECKF